MLYFVIQRNFINFLRSLTPEFLIYTLAESKRLYPKNEAQAKEKSLIWEKFSAEETKDIIFQEYRPSAPIKSFFSRAYEKVADYPKKTDTSELRPYCIVGVKACDLKSLITEDHVFLKGDYVDAAYRFYRENNIIISSDCSNFKSVCYCLHLELMPYPQKNFDLNISEVDNGFVVEAGSKKGEDLIKRKETLFQPARKELVEKRNRRRLELVERLKTNIDQMQMPASKRWPNLIREKSESQVWNKEALTCVECGACTQICPTCHCFLLGDQKSAFGYERFKIWDSCQYNGFARVAGGATPRPKRPMRLRNRYVKKFDYFPATMNEMACTGCGRCIEACAGKIDMRRIFSDLDKT